MMQHQKRRFMEKIDYITSLSLIHIFLHMNWVQGIYAFLCGLVLGTLFGRYRRLSYCMLLHAAVNGSSIFAALAQVLLPSGAATMARCV